MKSFLVVLKLLFQQLDKIFSMKIFLNKKTLKNFLKSKKKNQNIKKT